MLWGNRALSDRDGDQKLDLNEFCISMFLIGVAMRGAKVPVELPESLLVSIYGPQVPPAVQDLKTIIKRRDSFGGWAILF